MVTKKIKTSNQFWVTIDYLLFIIVIVSGIFWHFQATWHQAVFGDEIHSLFFFSEHSFLSLNIRAVEPIHPNGIYVLLKFLYSFTPSVLALRVWIFILFLASSVVFWQIMKVFSFKTNGKLAGLALWVSSAYLWHFSFQLRMYGPASLFVLLSFWSILKKKPWLSLLFDWLLLVFAYGGGLFVVAKWVAYLSLQALQLRKTKKPKNHFVTNLGLSLGVLIPITVIASHFWQNNSIVNQNFLYWVKTPVSADWSLGLFSFATGLFLPYFEGYSGLGQIWIQLGVATALLTLVGLITAMLFGYQYHTKLFLWFKTLNWTTQLLWFTCSISLIFYTALFFWSIGLNSHLFHIRQIFPIAIICWLGLSWLINQCSGKFAHLMTIMVLVVAGFNQVVIAKDSLGSGQAYVHHYTTLPGIPLLASPTEVELIYKQCHTFDRSEAKSRCADHDIYLVEANYKIDPNWIEWWQTSRITNQTSKNDSHSISYTCAYETVDYYHCQQKTE